MGSKSCWHTVWSLAAYHRPESWFDLCGQTAWQNRVGALGRYQAWYYCFEKDMRMERFTSGKRQNSWFGLFCLEMSSNPLKHLKTCFKGSQEVQEVQEMNLSLRVSWKLLENFTLTHAVGIFSKFTQDAQEHHMGQADSEVSVETRCLSSLKSITTHAKQTQKYHLGQVVLRAELQFKSVTHHNMSY
jgi:hypothetical protein